MEKKITTPNLILSSPSLDDATALENFENRNREHFKEWESTLNPNQDNQGYDSDACEKRLEMWIKECQEGKSVRFFVSTLGNPNMIIGMCNFTQIFYGPFQACYLGYKMDHAFEGKGFMFEALEASIQYMFEELGIHRIMSNYMPKNKRSAKLLQRLGFTIEGYAKNYLFINNKWEDHVLTALIVEEWKTKITSQR